MNKRLLLLVVFIVGCYLPEGKRADGGSGKVKPNHFVLFVAWDGARPDTVEAADTPNIDAIRQSGAFYATGYTGGELKEEPSDWNPSEKWNPYTAANLDVTASHASTMPGWTHMTTGVWANKHGLFRGANPTQSDIDWAPDTFGQYEDVVKDSEVALAKRWGEYPHFFARIKEFSKDTFCATMSTYLPWASLVPSHYDYIYHTLYSEYGMPIAVANIMKKVDHPTVTFTGYDLSDNNGHNHGYSPKRPEIKAYMHKEDAWFGKMLNAIETRPNYRNEYWLVIFTSDHGGFDIVEDGVMEGDHGGWWDGNSEAYPRDTFEDHKGYAEENRFIPILLWSNQWKPEDKIDTRFPAGKIEGQDQADTGILYPVVNLVPTVLEFLGVPLDSETYGDFDGESLLKECPGWKRLIDNGIYNETTGEFLK